MVEKKGRVASESVKGTMMISGLTMMLPRALEQVSSEGKMSRENRVRSDVIPQGESDDNQITNTHLSPHSLQYQHQYHLDDQIGSIPPTIELNINVSLHLIIHTIQYNIELWEVVRKEIVGCV